MKLESTSTKTVMCEEVVEHADDCIGPLSRIDGFINEVIDLNKMYCYCKKKGIPFIAHLSGDCFTAYTKDGTLPWCQEVHWARLLRVTRIVYLQV